MWSRSQQALAAGWTSEEGGVRSLPVKEIYRLKGA